MSENISQQIQILINQFNTRNYEFVISKCRILLKKNPEYVILYNLIGSAYQNTGKYSKAQKSFINGLKLDPKNIALMNNLAMSYKNLLKYQESQELYLKIISINDKYLNAYINLGNLKRDLNAFSEAIKLYEKALSINESNPNIHYLLALAHQGIGNFAKSISYSETALKLDSNFTRADHIISQSTKYENTSEHLKNLKNKINNFADKSHEKIDLYFSLAKAEEDLGNIEMASSYLLKGNALKKKIINYNVATEIDLLKDIKNKFELLPLENIPNQSDSNIIFILGMPRSGTSLVEQIITSHSEVFGGGELPILSKIIKDNFINEEHFIKGDFAKILSDGFVISSLRNEYLNYIKYFSYNEKFITDKAPLNFRWIGFIKYIFPNSKIIHCERDPKNNCLSMFKNLFEGGLNFTYDQEDLVKYYNEYRKLMTFWNSKYQNTIFNVQYENLIKNNQDEIKRIIDFCELNWEENCLNFHKNKTPIKTMSTAQARKPIYNSSLNQFDKFKKYLNIIDKSL